MEVYAPKVPSQKALHCANLLKTAQQQPANSKGPLEDSRFLLTLYPP